MKNLTPGALILIVSFFPITLLFTIGGQNFIQPSEIIFVFFLYFFLRHAFKIKTFSSLDLTLLFLLLISLFNLFWFRTTVVFFEVLGMCYLFTFYFILSRYIALSKDPYALISKCILGLLLVCIITGLGGYLLYVFKVTDRYMVLYAMYPYFGDIQRLCGLTESNLLLSCISIALFALPEIKINITWKVIFATLGIFISFLTYSKEFAVFLPLYIILLVSYKFPKIRNAKWILVLSIPLSIFMIIMSFFVIKPKSSSFRSVNLDNTSQIDESAAFSISKFEFYPTTYFHMFSSAVRMIKESPLIGIGSGNYKNKLREFKQMGLFPKSIALHHTHDLYWGQIAELGVLYLVFLIALLFQFYKIFLVNPEHSIGPLWFNLYITLLFFGICFLVGGSKHYRHLWMFLAILNGLILHQKQRRISVINELH